MNEMLGFITKEKRNQAQNDAAEAAVKKMKMYTLPVPKLAKGDKFMLSSLWSHPDVVADVGFVFNRFRQLTGSCVGVGGGNGLFSTICAQRVASNNPTKAFLPFWLSAYGMSRYYMGASGQGEGSMGSTFAKALEEDGITDWPNGADPLKLPDYNTSDGIAVSSQVELQWSSARHPELKALLPITRQHLLGSATPANNVEQIKALILNGYGVSVACSRYIGRGTIVGSGDLAYVRGEWDSNGGHQQSIHGYWEHPNDGPLYLVLNSWPGNQYPKDPAGGPVCSVWVPERKVEAVYNYGEEIFGFSSLDWFPAQPKILEWIF